MRCEELYGEGMSHQRLFYSIIIASYCVRSNKSLLISIRVVNM